MFQGFQQNNQLFFSYICIRVCVGRKVLFKMKKAGTKKKIKIRRWIIGILLGVGFLAMEFPGILLVRERIYPFVLGLPFLYGYILCCWVYMLSLIHISEPTRP